MNFEAISIIELKFTVRNTTRQYATISNLGTRIIINDSECSGSQELVMWYSKRRVQKRGPQ